MDRNGEVRAALPTSAKVGMAQPLTTTSAQHGLRRKGQSVATAADLVPGLRRHAPRGRRAGYIGQTVDDAYLAPTPERQVAADPAHNARALRREPRHSARGAEAREVDR